MQTSEQVQFISTTPQQLRELISEDVKSQLNELKKSFQPKEPSEFLSRAELAKLLKVDVSTIHNWTKKGKIISYGIGGRIFYKRKQVEDAIVQLKH